MTADVGPASMGVEDVARFLYDAYFGGKGAGLDTYCERAMKPWRAQAAAVRALVESKVREASDEMFRRWAGDTSGSNARELMVEQVVVRIMESKQ